MYLKALTLKGFKSFASATTLAFEPGVTCVVGPNGSGKSNVVDALAWVMGEQGAKTLRGGKMEDVIFAGTSGRAPLGRAEVSLTIDNSDGALPIEYSEVTITRTMFRSGGSDYAINGQACRLLDIQELLSDSGIGREMHVIVGQGQLDAILHATPEERRGFIEEAAGVLKHRKRKERAVRKLEAMAANLTRVSDLSKELRRQLTPLGRQAEVARRANVIAADLRDAGLRLLADDLASAQAQFAAETADDTALRERRALVEAELAGMRAEEAVREAQVAANAPAVKAAQETWFALSALRERLAGTVSMASDRVRGLAPEPVEERRGRDPEELLEESRRLRAQELALDAEVAQRRADLSSAVSARTVAESGLARAESDLRAALRGVADRREGLARLVGQAAAAQSRVEGRAAEIARLSDALAAASDRSRAADQQFAVLETSIAGLDAGEEDLDGAYEGASAVVADLDERIAALVEDETSCERGRAGLVARIEALAAMTQAADGSAALRGADLPGLLGPLSGSVQVESGFERAVAAALGPLAEAVVAQDPTAAGAALGWLAQEDAGRGALVIQAPELGLDPSPPPGVPDGDRHAGAQVPARSLDLPHGARLAIEVITAPPALASALSELLAGVVVVADLDAALALITAHPGLLACTRGGDLIGEGRAIGGTPGPAGSLEVAADLARSREDLSDLTHRMQRIRFEVSGLRAQREGAATEAAQALAALHDSDARMAAVAEQLGNLGAAARAATAEANRLAANLAASQQALAADERTRAELAQRVAHAQAAGEADSAEPSTADRDQAASAVDASRRVEMEARLAVRTAEERLRAIAGRAEQLERAARAEQAARARAAVRREARARAAGIAAAVAAGGREALQVLEASVAAAEQARGDAEADQARGDAGLREVRARVRTLAAELEELTSAVHRDEVARAQQRLRIEALAARAMSEFGMEAEALVADFGPHTLVPPSLRAPGDAEDPDTAPAEPTPYVRAEQERRLRTATKALALLGRVNPLALEEYAALEERHRFLAEQLEDLTRSRRDLLGLISDVDRRVEEVFTAAYIDTAAQFEAVFARLFPGGEGRLVLTDPQAMLTTGIDVEARPPGKRIKRLSLLSGGERSLTAVAFLVALFKARPSPFYVLDEVEAALDDVNLGRLLDVIEELRADSQLIVITHQKRTMEVADALYGVSMRGDGVTAVISQRLRERPAVVAQAP